MVKKRVRNELTKEQIEAFAEQAEGVKPTNKTTEGISRTTISLPKSLLTEIELQAFKNKQSGVEPKSVSALIREALQSYMKEG